MEQLKEAQSALAVLQREHESRASEVTRLRQEADQHQRDAEERNKTLATLLENEAEAHTVSIEQVWSRLSPSTCPLSLFSPLCLLSPSPSSFSRSPPRPLLIGSFSSPSLVPFLSLPRSLLPLRRSKCSKG